MFRFFGDYFCMRLNQKFGRKNEELKSLNQIITLDCKASAAGWGSGKTETSAGRTVETAKNKKTRKFFWIAEPVQRDSAVARKKVLLRAR
jgi:hypothetical protein